MSDPRLLARRHGHVGARRGIGDPVRRADGYVSAATFQTGAPVGIERVGGAARVAEEAP
jgi:hypothetical protein